MPEITEQDKNDATSRELFGHFAQFLGGADKIINTAQNTLGALENGLYGNNDPYSRRVAYPYPQQYPYGQTYQMPQQPQMPQPVQYGYGYGSCGFSNNGAFMSVDPAMGMYQQNQMPQQFAQMSNAGFSDSEYGIGNGGMY